MKCVKCGQIEKKPYKVKSGARKGKIQSYCRKCNHQNTLDRQRDFKNKCAEYKGSKCVCCGYDKYIGSLDFHHLDPNEKDFNIINSFYFDKFCTMERSTTSRSC